jgi:hypothetical protein
VNRLYWWAGGASILALVTVPAWALVSTPENDVGSLDPLRRARAAAPVETVGGGGLKLPKGVVRSGLLADKAVPNRGHIPRRLRIDAIGVYAPIVPVGVTHGTTQVPADVDTWAGINSVDVRGSQARHSCSPMCRREHRDRVCSSPSGARAGGRRERRDAERSWAAYQVFARRSYAKEAGRLACSVPSGLRCSSW